MKIIIAPYDSDDDNDDNNDSNNKKGLVLALGQI
jgi:hypothetical protein